MVDKLRIIYPEPTLSIECLEEIAKNCSENYFPDYDDIQYFADTFRIDIFDMYGWLTKYLTYLKRNRDRLNSYEVIIFDKLIRLIIVEQQDKETLLLQENA